MYDSSTRSTTAMATSTRQSRNEPNGRQARARTAPRLPPIGPGYQLRDRDQARLFRCRFGPTPVERSECRRREREE